MSAWRFTGLILGAGIGVICIGVGGIMNSLHIADQGAQIAQLQARLAHDEQAHAHVTAATCPPGLTCLSNVDITDNNGLGDALNVHDFMGNPMFWVDTFQAGSSNPVCAVAVKSASTGYLEREACLGGPPFDASGGHAVMALWDGSRWQLLTARDISWLHRAEQMRPNW